MKWLTADVFHYLNPVRQLRKLCPAQRLGAQEALIEGAALTGNQFALGSALNPLGDDL